MDGSFVIILMILAFVGLLVWQFMATKNALATTRVESRCPPHEAANVVIGAFGGARGALWTDASGPGSINKRRRGKDGGITMSIDTTHASTSPPPPNCSPRSPPPAGPERVNSVVPTALATRSADSPGRRDR
jgi:hypothetical protein